MMAGLELSPNVLYLRNAFGRTLPEFNSKSPRSNLSSPLLSDILSLVLAVVP